MVTIHAKPRRATLTLEDFQLGDDLIITSCSKRGVEPRAATVSCLNWKSNGLVTYAGRAHPSLLPTGQGAFNPRDHSRHTGRNGKPFGLAWRVHNVSAAGRKLAAARRASQQAAAYVTIDARP